MKKIMRQLYCLSALTLVLGMNLELLRAMETGILVHGVEEAGTIAAKEAGDEAALQAIKEAHPGMSDADAQAALKLQKLQKAGAIEHAPTVKPGALKPTVTETAEQQAKRIADAKAAAQTKLDQVTAAHKDLPATASEAERSAAQKAITKAQADADKATAEEMALQQRTAAQKSLAGRAKTQLAKAKQAAVDKLQKI